MCFFICTTFLQQKREPINVIILLPFSTGSLSFQNKATNNSIMEFYETLLKKIKTVNLLQHFNNILLNKFLQSFLDPLNCTLIYKDYDFDKGALPSDTPTVSGANTGIEFGWQ